MRLNLPALLACCMLLAAAGPAHARSAFFVQLGTAGSDEEAERKWNNLQSEFSALLEPLAFAPRTVTSMTGGESEIRVQAGPVKSREQAQKICSSLVARELDCFVVETAVFDGSASYPKLSRSSSPFAPPSAPVETAEAATQEPQKETSGFLPWLNFGSEEKADAENPPAAAPDENMQLAQAEAAEAPKEEVKEEPEEESGFFSWFSSLTGGDDDDEKEEAKSLLPPPPPPAEMVDTAQAEQPPVPVEQRSPYSESRMLPPGKVDVAEAIHVPLSEAPAVEAPDEQALLKDVAPAPHAMSIRPAIPARNDASWARISGFDGTDSAEKFSAALSGDMPDLTSRSYVTRPVQSRYTASRATVNVGPLADADAVASVCDFATRYDEELRCAVTVTTRPGQTLAARGEYPGNGGYMQGRLSPGAGGDMHARRTPTRYFAQLGSWENRAEAGERWETLKSAHGDLLKAFDLNLGTPSQISLNAKQNVRLRVGPFSGRRDAETLCGKFAKRGVDCLIVPE